MNEYQRVAVDFMLKDKALDTKVVFVARSLWGLLVTTLPRFPVAKAEETFTALGKLSAVAQPYRLIFAYLGRSKANGEGISIIDYTYQGHIEGVSIPITRIGQEIILGEEHKRGGETSEAKGLPEVDWIEKFFAAVRQG